MNESFLHFIWKYRLLQGPLTTTEGETLTVIHPGWHNHDAGPDFSTAKIKIGDTLWAGNVEIHVKASDWQKHQHQQDPAYKNIILHVVYENDQPVKAHLPPSWLKMPSTNPYMPDILTLFKTKTGFPVNIRQAP